MLRWSSAKNTQRALTSLTLRHFVINQSYIYIELSSKATVTIKWQKTKEAKTITIMNATIKQTIQLKLIEIVTMYIYMLTFSNTRVRATRNRTKTAKMQKPRTEHTLQSILSHAERDF